jgi:hypothetical protein
MKQLSMICLGNPKLTGGSIIEIAQAMTLTRVCEVNSTGNAPLG